MRVSVKVDKTSITGISIFDLRKRGNYNTFSDVQISTHTEIADYLKDLVNKDQESKDLAVKHANQNIDAAYDDLLEMSKDDLWEYLGNFDGCENLTREDSDILWHDHLEPY